MVENSTAHVHLHRAEAYSRGAAHDRLLAWRLAERDGKSLGIVCIRSKGTSVLPFQFIVAKFFTGEAKANHCLISDVSDSSGKVDTDSTLCCGVLRLRMFLRCA